MTSRIAVPSDLDQLVDVVLASMPSDPQWSYRFTHRHEFPDDHRKYTKMLWGMFVNPDYDDWVVHIIEDTVNGADKPSIVAFSAWNIAYANKRTHGPGYEPQNPPFEVMQNGGATRRDADTRRVAAFKDSGKVCDEKYLDAYGHEQIVLQILGTHPDHRRRQHASTLCRWGMDVARRQGLVITVQATALGRQVYEHLGFATLGECVMQVPGEEEKVPLWPMVWSVQKSEL